MAGVNSPRLLQPLRLYLTIVCWRAFRRGAQPFAYCGWSKSFSFASVLWASATALSSWCLTLAVMSSSSSVDMLFARQPARIAASSAEKCPQALQVRPYTFNKSSGDIAFRSGDGAALCRCSMASRTKSTIESLPKVHKTGLRIFRFVALWYHGSKLAPSRRLA